MVSSFNSQVSIFNTNLNTWMAGFSNAEGPLQFAAPKAIAEVVYEAATDGKDRLRYLAGNDALSTYEYRIKAGAEQFRKDIASGLGV